MTFEPLTSAHIPEVAAIEREAMAEPWSENMLRAELDSQNSHILVGIEDGKTVCYGGFRQALDEADILNVAVLASMRRKGLGREMMSRLIREAMTLGVRRLTLEVSEDNAPAIALYRSFGFERVGVRKRYYLDRFDALIMRLELPEGLDAQRI